MIAVIDHAEGSVLRVRVQPRARRVAVVGEHGGALKVAVTDPPDKGKANDAVIRLLSDRLALEGSRVRLIAGASSRDKRFLLVGVRPSDLVARLDQILRGTAP